MEKLEMKSIKHIIVVASGKGGVGKSTVSANLAIALSRKNLKVGLVDADIYGPSIPAMFGLGMLSPEMAMEDGKNKMKPFEKYGIKLMSIGFLVPEERAVIWRGPMASNAVKQLFTETIWGELDYLVIDFPPGTGDVQITTIQDLKIDGAIIVTTPQIISVNDARKSAEMLTNEALSVPFLGVVENMSWFTPLNHPEEKYFLFGKGGGQIIADEFYTSLLTKLPLVQEVGEMADKGKNLFMDNSNPMQDLFDKLAEDVINKIDNK
ncbi:MAG: Mrp/NBP35 family ATP-binding protein [Bacteroidales bacterium]|nr:Mrp/NBP35 family ATP-binding protein [Bacteroidales bacterium]